MEDYQKSFHWNKVNIWSDKLLSYTEVEISSFLTKFSSQAALEISSAAGDEYHVCQHDDISVSEQWYTSRW